MPSGAQTPDGITFSCSNLFKTLSPIFSFTMGLTGHTPESLNRHPNIPTTVPASSHDYAFLVPFAPPGFKLRRQGNLTSGGFLDGAHWAYTILWPFSPSKKSPLDPPSPWSWLGAYCLGSGITSTSPYEVATTVNSCLRNGEIQQGDGWFRHDGIGYRGENLKLTAGPRTGDWRYVEGGLTRPVPEMKELFTLTVEHGVKPRNASYIYTILPGATPEETAGTPPGRVLRNTPECQAVEFADGVRAAIFYEPGRLDDFETDTPGAFLIGKGTVHAADPTGRHSSFTLKLNGVSRKVPLPAGEFAGQSVKIVLK